MARLAGEGRRGKEDAVGRLQSRGIVEEEERDIGEVDVGNEPARRVGSLDLPVFFNANAFSAPHAAPTSRQASSAAASAEGLPPSPARRL